MRLLGFLTKREAPLLTQIDPLDSAIIVASLPFGFWFLRETADHGVDSPFYYATLLGDKSAFPIGALLGTALIDKYMLHQGESVERAYLWPRYASGALYLVLLVPIYLNWKNGTTMDALPDELKNLVSEWFHTLLAPAIGVALIRLGLAVGCSKAPWKLKLPIGLLPLGGIALGLCLDAILQGKST